MWFVYLFAKLVGEIYISLLFNGLCVSGRLCLRVICAELFCADNR